jgi:hypothetical protein
MHNETNEPADIPADNATTPPVRWRAALLLGMGMGVGLAAGVLLTVSVSATYSLFTPTIRPNRDWVEVFNELNDLRQQVNRMNEARKLQDEETVAAIRQALTTVATTPRPVGQGTAGLVAAPDQPPGVTDRPPPRRALDPLAEVDEEIKRLEDTQRVLNTILDMFTPKNKERPKDRSGVKEPPE